MIPITINNSIVFEVNSKTSLNDIKTKISSTFNINSNDFYLVQNGKILNNTPYSTSKIDVVFRLVGGKGGFGSMLRAIGAQIEKTTNREACRDLSGRRLRDINEEKRLKKWIEQQAEREQEAADKKQKKLERLCEKPKLSAFKDEAYDRMRSELPEIIEDSIAQGMKKASELKVGLKRKNDDNGKGTGKKKKLWLDDDLEDLDTSSDDSECEDQSKSKEICLGESNEDEASCSSEKEIVEKEDDVNKCENDKKKNE
ncbi:splicing regulator SDE2 [Onthophagus taurus]|uniref:splicing regulator SDE2 n=1 Tax=Onthophagus taurus TaxID=166361 RepID=UPI0039BDE726